MKKQTMRLVLVFSLLMAGLVVTVQAHHGPEKVVLSASMGDVTFEHFSHQDAVEDCTTCHHAGVEAGKCSSCHGVNEDAPSAKDAFHKSCKGCHQEVGGNAPTKCKGCHVK